MSDFFTECGKARKLKESGNQVSYNPIKGKKEGGEKNPKQNIEALFQMFALEEMCHRKVKITIIIFLMSLV